MRVHNIILIQLNWTVAHSFFPTQLCIAKDTPIKGKLQLIFIISDKNVISFFLKYLSFRLLRKQNICACSTRSSTVNLIYIKYFWAEAKQYSCLHCNYSFKHLKEVVSRALDSIGLTKIHWFSRRSAR